MNSPEKIQEYGPQELPSRTEYCNLGEKIGELHREIKEVKRQKVRFGTVVCGHVHYI